jgi:uncharacterized protein (TIGR02217 family)
MSFIEQRLPDDQNYGAVGGPSFSTDIVATASGHEHRNANWSQARGSYDIGYTRNQAQLNALIAFFRACHGRAYGFRYRDHTDYRVLLADGRIGSAVGDGTPGPHQLRKRYTSGSSTTDRDIRKPAGTPAIYRGGVLQAVTTHYTLDTTTGLVTWEFDATSAATSITVGDTTTVVLAGNPGTLIAGESLYLRDFTGADAAQLNGLAHTINSVSGAGPYTFVLATNTSGKTITLGSGVGRKYPQASESLTWTGEFDVPVRFDADEIRATMLESGAANRMYSVASLGLMEIKV